SPIGRGRREAAGEGPGLAQNFAEPNPHPALRATFSRREKGTANQTDRVATTGGTAAARSAGTSTANCPSNHSAIAPTGKYHKGRRGTSKNFINPRLMPIASA